MMPNCRIAVIGAGQAGLSLCAALRSGGHTGPLTLVGAEVLAPYQRPPLSKAYLAGTFAESRLPLKPESFYEQSAIDLRRNDAAASVDRRARRITLESGTELAYDLLALTTGARARRLPPSLGTGVSRVLTLRDVADSRRIAERFATARTLLVIGGGYIGLEIAASARKADLEVTVVEAAPRLLARVAGAETARRIAALHRDHGTSIRVEAGLRQLEAAGNAVRARFADGSETVAELVVAGVGAEPATDLAETAGLALENGIRVDAFCRSSDPAIFAAGDCASFPWRGGRVRLESVQNAIDQGEAAARNMLGEAIAYDPVPWFWSDQYDAHLQIAGISQGADRTVVRAAHGIRPASVWYFRGSELVAVDALNEPRAFMVGRRLIAAGRTPDPAAVADPASNLKELL